MPLMIIDDMTDPDRPVTRRELREELEAVLKTLATKEDIKAFATKEDLSEGLREMRSHFDAVAEHFQGQFAMLHDAMRVGFEGLDRRIRVIETEHGSRLLAVETRVTALELGHTPKKRKPLS